MASNRIGTVNNHGSAQFGDNNKQTNHQHSPAIPHTSHRRAKSLVTQAVKKLSFGGARISRLTWVTLLAIRDEWAEDQLEMLRGVADDLRFRQQIASIDDMLAPVYGEDAFAVDRDVLLVSRAAESTTKLLGRYPHLCDPRAMSYIDFFSLASHVGEITLESPSMLTAGGTLVGAYEFLQPLGRLLKTMGVQPKERRRLVWCAILGGVCLLSDSLLRRGIEHLTQAGLELAAGSSVFEWFGSRSALERTVLLKFVGATDNRTPEAQHVAVRFLISAMCESDLTHDNIQHILAAAKAQIEGSHQFITSIGNCDLIGRKKEMTTEDIVDMLLMLDTVFNKQHDIRFSLVDYSEKQSRFAYTSAAGMQAAIEEKLRIAFPRKYCPTANCFIVIDVDADLCGECYLKQRRKGSWAQEYFSGVDKDFGGMDCDNEEDDDDYDFDVAMEEFGKM